MALTANQNDTVVLNGVVLQNFDSIGINQLDGRGGSPAPVYASEQRVQANGAWVTKAYDSPMSFTLGGWVSGATVDRRDHFLAVVRGSAATSDCLLTFPFNGNYVTYTVRRTSEFNVTFLNDNTAFWTFTVTAFNPVGRLGGQRITYRGESSGFHRYVPQKRKAAPSYAGSRSAYRPQKRKTSPDYKSNGTSAYKPMKRAAVPSYDDGRNSYKPMKRVTAALWDSRYDAYKPMKRNPAPDYTAYGTFSAPTVTDPGLAPYALVSAFLVPSTDVGSDVVIWPKSPAVVDSGSGGDSTDSTVDAPVTDPGDGGIGDPSVPDTSIDRSNGWVPNSDDSQLYYQLEFPDGFFDGLDMDEDESLIQASTTWSNNQAADAFKFPFSFSKGQKMSFGSLAKQRGTILLNAPTDTAGLMFKIQGACTSPSITVISSTGESHTLEWDYLVMSANDHLDVDCTQHLAALNDNASRPPSARDWPEVSSGQTTFIFNADTASSSTVFTVYMEPLI